MGSPTWGKFWATSFPSTAEKLTWGNLPPLKLKSKVATTEEDLEAQGEKQNKQQQQKRICHSLRASFVPLCLQQNAAALQ